jgi:AcrR family transcriptional regulator
MGTVFQPFDPSAGAATERCDAARNRARVLTAAERLFAERGAEGVSMDEIAHEAGVGKGTLYRRFGDKAGLALALLSERERAFQERILRGPPPLGPGAPPAERLGAFLVALGDILEANLDLLLAAESAGSGGRYRALLYTSYRLHVAVLLREAYGGRDPGVMPDLVLAPLAADLYRHLRRDREVSRAQIAEALLDLAARAAAGPAVSASRA